MIDLRLYFRKPKIKIHISRLFTTKIDECYFQIKLIRNVIYNLNRQAFQSKRFIIFFCPGHIILNYIKKKHTCSRIRVIEQIIINYSFKLIVKEKRTNFYSILKTVN